MNFTPMIDPRFPPLIRPLTKKELSDWLNCSERFLELEVNAGRLKKVTLGANRVRFLPRDVNDWLEAGGSTVKRRKTKAKAKGETVAESTTGS
jgi:hypothetical protein